MRDCASRSLHHHCKQMILTFSHNSGELSGNVTVRDGRRRGVSIAGGCVVGMKSLAGRIFIRHWLCRVWRSSGWLLRGLRQRAVSLDGRDDDLLQLLQSIAQVSSFQNILQTSEGSTLVSHKSPIANEDPINQKAEREFPDPAEASHMKTNYYLLIVLRI